MLSEPKLKLFLDLINSSSKDELIWINGYLTGIIGQSGGTVSEKTSANKITILYGTETGNSKKLATDFAVKAKKNGIQVKISGLDQYRLNDLPKEEYLVTVISTQGEGEPPVSAKKFYDHLHKNGFKLEKLKYGVLALGDTSYPLFCKAGEDVDTQLKQLGGERIAPLQKCDLDYEEEANTWFDNLLKSLDQPLNKHSSTPNVLPVKKSAGKTIYHGTVLTNINLNDKGSNKETRHIEIAAEDIMYECGDSIGIVPKNPARIIEEIISRSCLYANKLFQHKNDESTIFEILQNKVSIIQLNERIVKKYAEIVGQEIPIEKTDLLDLIKKYPLKDDLQLQEVLNSMNAISPRLYTIASSPTAHQGEVHLTVVKNEFEIDEERKYGLCSDFLSSFGTNKHLTFFVQKNKRFRLPTAEKDIIMIGPGTGVAAFRSFVAERDVTGASGKNWLFFGEQKFITDFLYQTEWQNYLSTGVLTKLTLAFSRDQQEKIYVQHKLKQEAKEVMQWIDNGAYIYICGAKDPMSVEVENTLIEIIGQQKNISEDAAKEFLKNLKEAGRYEKDVY